MKSPLCKRHVRDSGQASVITGQALGSWWSTPPPNFHFTDRNWPPAQPKLRVPRAHSQVIQQPSRGGRPLRIALDGVHLILKGYSGGVTTPRLTRCPSAQAAEWGAGLCPGSAPSRCPGGTTSQSTRRWTTGCHSDGRGTRREVRARPNFPPPGRRPAPRVSRSRARGGLGRPQGWGGRASPPLPPAHAAFASPGC